MRLKKALLSAIAMVAVLAGCNKSEDVKAPVVTLDKQELTFDVAGGEQSVLLTSTRDWKATTTATWVSVEPKEGKEAEGVAVTIKASANEGQKREATITFNGVVTKTLTVKQGGTASVVTPEGTKQKQNTANAVYYNNFDKALVSKGDKGWPFIDKTDAWQNAQGSGVADAQLVDGKGVSVRSGHGSNENSQYNGSGQNKIFFGRAPQIFGFKNITLPESRNYELSFGVNRYEYNNKATTIDKAQLNLYVSADGQKWVKVDYNFSQEVKAGMWSLAIAKFAVPAGVNTLAFCIECTESSQYSIDDVCLNTVATNETVLDFTKGAALNSQEAGKYDFNIAWANVDNAVEFFIQPNNDNSKVYKAVKLGTGSKHGSVELTIPAYTTELSFFAYAWAFKPCELGIYLQDQQVHSIKVSAASDLKGTVGQKATEPFVVALVDNLKQKIDVKQMLGGNPLTSDVKIVVKTQGTNTRCVLIAVQAKVEKPAN